MGAPRAARPRVIRFLLEFFLICLSGLLIPAGFWAFLRLVEMARGRRER